MAGRHSQLAPADGIHTPVAFTFSNQTARLASSGYEAVDQYKVAVDIDTGLLWYIREVTPPNGDAVWSSFSDGAIQAATAPPTAVEVGSGAAGSSGEYARADHDHALAAGTPVDVGASNAEGSATTVARSDHQHDHGDQLGGSLHVEATPGVAGFMSPGDKTKLDSYPATLPVFGQNYSYTADESRLTTTSSTYQETVRLTTAVLPAGVYLVQWSAKIANQNPGYTRLYDVTNGLTLDEVYFDGSGTVEFNHAGGFREVDVATPEVREFSIDHRDDFGGSSQVIEQKRIVLWRVQ